MLVKKSLVDVAFMSEKRKLVLLLLKDGARDMEDLLFALDTSRMALLPQVRILEEHHLVSHYRDTYELTKIGKLVVDEMCPLLDTIDVLNEGISYWGTRSLDFIPPHLLNRINELGKSKIITPSPADMYDIHDDFHEMSKNSSAVFSVTSFLYSHFPELFDEITLHGAHMNVIIPGELFDKLRMSNSIGLERILSNNRVDLFVHPGSFRFLSFGYNDNNAILTPLNDSGDFDNRHILCTDPRALQWIKELYEHYLKDAVAVTLMDVRPTLQADAN